MDGVTIPGLNTKIMNSFQTVMESIAKARLRDTFSVPHFNMDSTQTKMYAVDKQQTPTEMPQGHRNSSPCRLHMGIIGCLPDNVQQALRSFSIKPGKQHLTLAFPFMVEMVRACSTEDHVKIKHKSDEMCSAMYVEFGPEVVSGFRSLSTMILDKERLSLTVAVFTLYEVNSIEGILRHFDSTVRMMIHSKTPITLWKHPICVIDIGSDLKGAIFSSVVDTILDIQHENIQHSFPGKSRQELYLHLKEKVISQRFRSYDDHFRQCLIRFSETSNSSTYRHLMSILNHITDPRCTVSDFNTVKHYVKTSPLPMKRFWAIWGHDQIAPKIFPAAKISQSSNHLQFARNEMMERPFTGAQVSIKEVLKNIIDSLKHQEISGHKCVESEIEACTYIGSSDKEAASQALPLALNEGRPHDRSAFHRPEKVKRYHQSTTPYSDALKAVAVSPHRRDFGSDIYATNRKSSNRIWAYSTSPLLALYCDFFGTKYQRTNNSEPTSTNCL